MARTGLIAGHYQQAARAAHPHLHPHADAGHTSTHSQSPELQNQESQNPDEQIAGERAEDIAGGTKDGSMQSTPTGSPPVPQQAPLRVGPRTWRTREAGSQASPIRTRRFAHPGSSQSSSPLQPNQKLRPYDFGSLVSIQMFKRRLCPH